MSSHSLENRDSSHITVARENKHHNPSFPKLLSKEDVRPLICGVLCEALSWIRGLGSTMCRALGSWAASVTEFLTSGVGGGGRGCMPVHPSEPLLGKTFSSREHLTLVLGHRKSLYLGERLPALLMASRVQWQRGNLGLGQFVQSSSRSVIQDSPGVYFQVWNSCHPRTDICSVSAEVGVCHGSHSKLLRVAQALQMLWICIRHSVSYLPRNCILKGFYTLETKHICIFFLSPALTGKSCLQKSPGSTVGCRETGIWWWGMSL